MALLAYLAMRADEHISRAHLAALLWSESADEQARANLRQTLSQLRKLFRDAAWDPIMAPFDKVVLVSDKIEIDARAALNGKSGRDPREFATRPEFLEGFSVPAPEFDNWMALQRNMIRTQYVADLDSAAIKAEQNRHYVAAAEHLSLALKIDPLQEALYRRLMGVLAAQGRADEALAQYDTCRDRLAAELRVEPDAETRALASRIRATRRRTSFEREPATIRRASVSEPIEQTILSGVNGPRIAVLPFRNLSPNPDEEFFVDGLVEEMTLALSASRSFPVIASSATIAFKGRGVAPNVAGKELGAQYVLDGSVRRAGDRLRISVELVNVDTQLQEWSERYEHSIDDLFAIQDDITRAVVAEVEPEIDELEVRRMLSSRPTNFSSYELAQKGFWHLSKRTVEDYEVARPLFQMSLQLDQRYARAYAGMAQGKYMAGLRLWEDRRGALEKAVEFGAAALDIDERDPRALRYLGGAKATLGQYAEGIEALRHAIALHPSYATAYSALALALVLVGNFEAAIQAEATTTRLRPGDRALYMCMMSRAVAKYELGDYDTAAQVCRESLELNDKFWMSNLLHVAALGQRGRGDELPAAVARLQAILPDLTEVKLAELLPFEQRAHLEHVIEGLRKAGLNTA